MKSQALQELVRKIFSDEEIKSQFLANPDGVLAKFPLTWEEKKAVLKTHARIGLLNSDSAQLEAIIEPYEKWF